MPDLPGDIRKVINARADDAIRAIWQAVEDKDRSALVFACRELIDVVEDERAAAKEWTA